MPNSLNETSFKNRRLLLKGLGTLPLALGYTSARANSMQACELSFRHTHTDECLNLIYRHGETYDLKALLRINFLMRDFRTGDVVAIDPGVLDILHEVGNRCGSHHFEIISAYRSPTTNTLLRRRGGGGVARHSFHLEGRAIDVRIPGVDSARLRDAALELGQGGVGFYPIEDFVHIDTGPVRTWGQTES
ncbi:MAG: DUF882 domain-containing protein [Zoogloeaceae bacterium]|nr:DUF882 domain-containing protein [Zoogloeaceae bacterium]